MSDVDTTSRLKALNALINEKKIKASMNNGKIFYELVIEEKTPDDIVFEIIKDSDKNGIWIRDIRFKTKLSQVVLNKTLKNLENKKLIRPIKAISNRKLYILYDYQPDESITGGACYESGSIRGEIVNNLKATCLKYLRNLYDNCYKEMITEIHNEDVALFDFNRIYSTSSDILNFFKSRKMFSEIKIGDIETILNVLFYESKLIRIENNNRFLFRINPQSRDRFDLFYSPCLICPLFRECKPLSNKISPNKCRYIDYKQF